MYVKVTAKERFITKIQRGGRYVIITGNTNGDHTGFNRILPVSSSGHLAILRYYLVDTDTGLLFDVLLHIGTLAAICIVYYKDVLK